MTLFAVFILLASGGYMQTSVPPFKSKVECERYLADVDLGYIEAKCLELNVARSKP